MGGQLQPLELQQRNIESTTSLENSPYRSSQLLSALLAFVLVANCVVAMALDNSVDPRPAPQLLAQHRPRAQAPLPFSFAYDRKGSRGLLKARAKKIEARK